MSSNGKTHAIEETAVELSHGDEEVDQEEEPIIIRVSWIDAFNPFSKHCFYVNRACQVYEDYIEPWLPPCTEIRSRWTWVITLVLLGTLNATLNVLNLVYFTLMPLEYGLVAGPPSFIKWVVLCVFTAISLLLYILVTLNTISVFRYDGHPFLPIHYELLITIPFEHIPLGAVNYFICWCRIDVTTYLQSLCGAVGIVLIFLRILWYAHLEGGLLKTNDKRPVALAPFMAACALYGLYMSFPVQNWRVEPAQRLQISHTNNVSIFLLQATTLPGDYIVTNFQANDLLAQEGLSLSSPALLPSIASAVAAGPNGTFAKHSCDREMRPQECLCSRHGYLNFRFVYNRSFPGNPYGVIRYNFAYVADSRAQQLCDMEQRCTSSKADLQEGRRLKYLTMNSYKQHGSRYVNISSPNTWGCYVPKPLYDNTIDACSEF